MIPIANGNTDVVTANTVRGRGGGTRRSRCTKGVSIRQTSPVMAAMNSIRPANTSSDWEPLDEVKTIARSPAPMISAPSVATSDNIHATVTASPRRSSAGGVYLPGDCR